MKKMNMKWLTVIALVFSLTSGITGAMAYFTDTTCAEGTQVISLGVPWVPHEVVDEKGKHLTIENTGDIPLYVRAFIIGDGESIDGVDVTVTPKNGNDWFKDGTYWYYKAPLEPHTTTTELFAEVKVTGTTLEEFNIVVSEEATLLIYDSTKNEPYPNGKDYKGWNLSADFDTSYQGGK